MRPVRIRTQMDLQQNCVKVYLRAGSEKRYGMVPMVRTCGGNDRLWIGSLNTIRRLRSEWMQPFSLDVPYHRLLPCNLGMPLKFMSMDQVPKGVRAGR